MPCVNLTQLYFLEYVVSSTASYSRSFALFSMAAVAQTTAAGSTFRIVRRIGPRNPARNDPQFGYGRLFDQRMFPIHNAGGGGAGGLLGDFPHPALSEPR